MKEKLSIKNIFYDSWLGFINNFIDWMMLFVKQLVFSIIFLLCFGLILAVGMYFSIDFITIDNLHNKFIVIPLIAIVSIWLLFFLNAFSIMYIQNSLDIALKKRMSGFDINDRFFSYFIGVSFYWIIVALGVICLILPGLFLAQRFRFVGFFLLDQGGSIRHAFKQSWIMTKGNVWFLIGVSVLQWSLYLFSVPTVILIFFTMIIKILVDANLYKQLK